VRFGFDEGARREDLFPSGALDTRYLVFVMPQLAAVLAYVLVVHRWQGWGGRVLQLTQGTLAVLISASCCQLLIPFHTAGTSLRVVGRVPIVWDVLYHGADRNEYVLGHLPLVRYVNEHLSPSTDKIYDTTKELVRSYLYCDVEVFNGGTYDGPVGLGEWSLDSADALERLRRERITHVAAYPKVWPWRRLSETPVGRYLMEEWRDGETEVLYRVDYPPTG
jgi:hypothetical protein